MWFISPAPRRVRLLAVAVMLPSAVAVARARESGDPIAVQWAEGDVGGMTAILSTEARDQIGFIDYHQRRRGDVLQTVRVARFADGSSDEDEAEARVGATLEALRGRSVIRDASGAAIVDLTIDVAGGRLSGTYGLGKDRQSFDEHVALPSGTYWGPLIFLVLKNFDQNASDDRLVFRTVVPTPAPRVIDLELLRQGSDDLVRPGGRIDVVRYTLRPTIHWLIDPIIQRLVPHTEFLVEPGDPPSLASFVGPRNFGGEEVRIE